MFVFAIVGASIVGLIVAGFANQHPVFGLVALGASLLGLCWGESPFGGIVLGGAAMFAVIFLGISSGLVALAVFATFVLWGIKGS